MKISQDFENLGVQLLLRNFNAIDVTSTTWSCAFLEN
ncbi:unnamed protein product, partial [Rotaria sordida]